MSDVEKTTAPTTDEYFGGCPECGRVDKTWNIRKSHAHGCSVHKTAWWVGSGLFSSWMWENEEILGAQRQRAGGLPGGRTHLSTGRPSACCRAHGALGG